MEARFQSSHTSQNQRLAAPVGARFQQYAHAHPKTITIAAVLAVVTAFAIPLAVQALSDDGPAITKNNVTQPEQPAAAQSSNVPQTDKQSQQTVNSEHTSHSTASNDSQTTVTVNGQRVTVPDNGNYSKTVENGNSRTDINVESNHSSTTTGDSAKNNSSVDINIKSESHSSSSD